MPELVIMKLDVHIMPPEAISMTCFINPPIGNTSTGISQIVEEITIKLLEWLN
jgi:hypothetical protein